MRLMQLIVPALALLARQPPRLQLAKKAPALLRRASASRTEHAAVQPADPERAKQWLVDPYAFAPTPVTDVCGGSPGHTLLTEISAECSTWTVHFLRCVQGCKQTNYLKGFGECMGNCGVVNPNATVLCGTGTVAKNVSDTCNHAMTKLDTCNCTNVEVQHADELILCLDECVFNCDHSLTLQLELGIPVEWRPRKCPRTIFACTGDGPTGCTQLPQCGPWDTKGCIEAECESPVGHGKLICHPDSPTCGIAPVQATADPFQVCPAPPPPPPEPVVLNINGTNGTNGTNITLPAFPVESGPRRRSPWYPRAGKPELRGAPAGFPAW